MPTRRGIRHRVPAILRFRLRCSVQLTRWVIVCLAVIKVELVLATVSVPSAVLQSVATFLRLLGPLNRCTCPLSRDRYASTVVELFRPVKGHLTSNTVLTCLSLSRCLALQLPFPCPLVKVWCTVVLVDAMAPKLSLL